MGELGSLGGNDNHSDGGIRVVGRDSGFTGNIVRIIIIISGKVHGSIISYRSVAIVVALAKERPMADVDAVVEGRGCERCR